MLARKRITPPQITPGNTEFRRRQSDSGKEEIEEVLITVCSRYCSVVHCMIKGLIFIFAVGILSVTAHGEKHTEKTQISKKVLIFAS